MSWLNKDTQIATLAMLELQDISYKHFLEMYGTQTLALKHTKIFMDSMAIMVGVTNANK